MLCPDDKVDMIKETKHYAYDKDVYVIYRCPKCGMEIAEEDLEEYER